MEPYWEEEDVEQLAHARTFEDLRQIATRVLRRMPQPIAQVCGPISTGSTGTIGENLERLHGAIEKLKANGVSVFNQVPFEMPMQRIKSYRPDAGNVTLLNEFYLPLFKSRFVDTLYFLPGWESSQGASWEHEQALRLGLDIVYLDAKDR